MVAHDIICDLDKVERANWLIGNLQTGEQVALCDADLVMWCLGHLDAELGAEAKAAVVARWTPEPAGTPPEAAGAAEPPKSRRGRGRTRRDPGSAATAVSEGPKTEEKALPAGDQEPDQRVAETPPTPDHG